MGQLGQEKRILQNKIKIIQRIGSLTKSLKAVIEHHFPRRNIEIPNQ